MGIVASVKEFPKDVAVIDSQFLRRIFGGPLVKEGFLEMQHSPVVSLSRWSFGILTDNGVIGEIDLDV